MALERVKSIIKSSRRSLRSIMQPQAFSSNLFIVGAQKAGTTSLHKYLEKSPDTVSGDLKEIEFFYLDKMYERGYSYYRSFFPVFSSAQCVLDSSPNYLYYPEVAEKIYSYSPDAKIVIVLREPVSRAFSAYNMYSQLLNSNNKWFKYNLKKSNKSSRDFFEPIIAGNNVPSLSWFLEQEIKTIEAGEAIGEPSLIRRGIYMPQIGRYIKTFGRSNVLIIFSDDLKENTSHVMNRVLKFAGLPSVLHQEFPLHHVRHYDADKSDKILIEEVAHQWFAQDKLDLAKKLQIDVPW